MKLLALCDVEKNHYRHPPHGGCGLKFFVNCCFKSKCESPSTRRVWIEITLLIYEDRFKGSPSTRRVWIEIIPLTYSFSIRSSPSTRRVWIEILRQRADYKCQERHPPHGGCGLKSKMLQGYHQNPKGHPPHGGCGLKLKLQFLYRYQNRSPSTRRVWIEIRRICTVLASGVSSPSTRRVWIEIISLSWSSVFVSSPSTRRVWIEIQ